MSHISSHRSLTFSILLCSIHLLFTSGVADDPSSTKESKNAANNHASGTVVGLRVLIVLLGLVAVVAFSVFLFKIWQKKKREAQHARLLKLFEDDDELEVELGIRD